MTTIFYTDLTLPLPASDPLLGPRALRTGLNLLMRLLWPSGLCFLCSSHPGLLWILWAPRTFTLPSVPEPLPIWYHDTHCKPHPATYPFPKVSLAHLPTSSGKPYWAPRSRLPGMPATQSSMFLSFMTFLVAMTCLFMQCHSCLSLPDTSSMRAGPDWPGPSAKCLTDKYG